MKGENFMKQILYYLVLFILFSCSGDQPQFLWEKMIKHRQANELSESIAILHEIIKEFSNSEYAPKATFQIGDIYLNEIKDYDFAIKYFKNILNEYPNSSESEKANFMIGYVYSNNLQSYTEAQEYYLLFLEKYPNSQLIPSVNYELEILDPKFIKIDSLNAIIRKFK